MPVLLTRPDPQEESGPAGGWGLCRGNPLRGQGHGFMGLFWVTRMGEYFRCLDMIQVVQVWLDFFQRVESFCITRYSRYSRLCVLAVMEQVDVTIVGGEFLWFFMDFANNIRWSYRPLHCPSSEASGCFGPSAG